MIYIPFSIFLLTCFIGEFIRYFIPKYRINLKSPNLYPAILVSFFNLFIGTLVLNLIEIYCLSENKSVSIFKIIFGLFLSDTFFYWSHRLLHTEYFFKKGHLFHHIHHDPIVWTALYFHPIEFVFALIGIFILPVIFTFMTKLEANCFWSIIMFSLVLSHSGLINLSEHHDFHHKNWRYNFGSDIGIWDKLMKTEYK